MLASPPASADETGASTGPQTCITKNGDGSVRILAPGDCAQYGKQGPGRTDARARNAILIIGDGLGLQEITAARNYLKGAAGRFDGLDDFVATGSYTHFSVGQDGSFDYLTDSAASATGWATGTKTYDGAVGVDMAGDPVQNLLEMAKNAGMRTGNVTTAALQDATPAVMGAHSLVRSCFGPNSEEHSSCSGDPYDVQYREHGGLGSISEQLIDTRADVMLGGGARYFDEEVQASGPGRNPYLDNVTTWTEGESVLRNAEDNGFQVVTTAEELEKVSHADQQTPLLGLFSDGTMTPKFTRSMTTEDGTQEPPQRCDLRDTGTQPELVEMATKAIDLLDDPQTDKGFFLQVESAAIDKRDHLADGCGMIGEVDRLDETVRAALDFAARDGRTLVVVTADHAQSAQVIYDGAETVSPSTRLLTEDRVAQSLGWGTRPADEVIGNRSASLQHTGSQVRIAAAGPGAQNVIGQTDQTDTHFTIANALGLGEWTKAPADHELAVDISTAADPLEARETCYLVGADGSVAPGAGDCAQFGAAGQGLDATKAKNVVVLIADGASDSEITSARNYLLGAAGRFPGVDEVPYTGWATTFALDQDTGLPDLVTDSAAAGTALNTGVKTFSGALGIDLAGNPVPTIAELARKAGMKVGNVTTARIQDATPAAFAAHSLSRGCYGPEMDENSSSCQGEQYAAQYRENGGLGSISEQLVDLRADVALGGGSQIFDQIVQQGGDWAGHQWSAGISVLDNAKSQGFQVVTTADELDAISQADSDAPLLGLFADGHFPRNFERSIPKVDAAVEPAIRCETNPQRPDSIPALDAMTTKAMDLLRNDKGFFLQVEAASVDKAGHDADFCGQAGEFEEYDKAVQAARAWAAKTGEPTLIIATTDHAQTSQITAVGENTAGRTTTVVTADGDEMTINWATAASNDNGTALGGQGHTGAQVRVAGEGPGAANLLGQLDQTDIAIAASNAMGLDLVNNDIDLTPQWNKESQYPVSESGGRGAGWLIVAGIALVVAIGGGAFWYARFGRRKTAA